jgi:hypothetical protein
MTHDRRRTWVMITPSLTMAPRLRSNSLTITDNVEFAELGGHNLFFEHKKIRFSINLEATGRSRVKLSSELLALATIVMDRPEAR